MIRRSLFLKIYLTLIASLALVAFASALFVHFSRGEEDTGWRGRRDRFVAAMLPADADPASLQVTLDRLAAALDADLALYGADGRPIASSGIPFPDDVLSRRGRRDGADGRILLIRLPDGRAVAARMEKPFGPGGGRSPLGYLAMIAAVIGLAAYPVVRHLTRRLERLRRGVDAWGGGALATRVPDGGGDEVAAVARSFNKAADHIEQLLAAHRALLANASHELRSPLARLRMAIDLYEHAGDDRRKREIVQNLGELDALVEEILLASRLDHIEKLDHAEPVDLLALAAEEGAKNGVAVSAASDQETGPRKDPMPGQLASGPKVEPGRGRNATPEQTDRAAFLPSGRFVVTGDARLLTRLVRNLIQNALRHGAPPVEVEVAGDGVTVRLSVRDHGAGVPEGERSRVFEPFYRPSGRSETAGGWGLGLSLVRQIARHHGATLRYEAPADGGARFVVEFPAG